MNKILKTIGNITFYFLIIGLLTFSLFFIKSTRLHEMPSIGGYSMYVVKTGSMAPTINPGSLVIIKKVLPNDIKKGDIITFKGSEKGILFTHRVYEIKQKNPLKIITKGDANSSVDLNFLNEKSIVGKLVFSVPYVGNIISFIQTNWPLILFLIVGFSILIMLLKKFLNIDKMEVEKK